MESSQIALKLVLEAIGVNDWRNLNFTLAWDLIFDLQEKEILDLGYMKRACCATEGIGGSGDLVSDLERIVSVVKHGKVPEKTLRPEVKEQLEEYKKSDSYQEIKAKYA